MTINNAPLKQGKVIPGSDTSADVNISDSQYILNWIAAGGDQKNSDLLGNNNKTSIFRSDVSYNIPDNKISFYFEDPKDNNISIRDAQNIANFDKGLASIKSQEYYYPESKDFICLVVHEDLTFNDGTKIHKNKLYLKRKNGLINSDTSFNNYILANCIPYLNLDKGNIIKRDDRITEDGSNSIVFYKVGSDANNNIVRDEFLTISGDHLHGLNEEIQTNSNNLFPPTKELLDTEYITQGTLPNDFISIKHMPIISYSSTQSVFGTWNDFSNIAIQTPWWTGTDNSSVATSYANYYDNIYSVGNMYIYNFDVSNAYGVIRNYNNLIINHTLRLTDNNIYPYSLPIPVYASPNIPIYTYLGINSDLPINPNIKYTTDYYTVNNRATPVKLQNLGLQGLDISSSSGTNRLTQTDTLNTGTTNLLNNGYFNKTSWFLAGQDVNETQGHFIGQFVFDVSAQGTMIYQYYYSEECEDIFPSSNANEDSPYNIYFNIKDGKLEFPEKWTVTNETFFKDHN